MFSKLSKCVCFGSALGLAAGADGLKLSLTQHDGDTIVERQHRDGDPFSDTSDEFATISQQENEESNNRANQILDRYRESEAFVQDLRKKQKEESARRCKAASEERMRTHQEVQKRLDLIFGRDDQAELKAAELKAAEEAKRRTVTKKDQGAPLQVRRRPLRFNKDALSEEGKENYEAAQPGGARYADLFDAHCAADEQHRMALKAKEAELQVEDAKNALLFESEVEVANMALQNITNRHQAQSPQAQARGNHLRSPSHQSGPKKPLANTISPTNSTARNSRTKSTARRQSARAQFRHLR